MSVRSAARPAAFGWHLALASVALAGLSLFLLPGSLAYDPWSWLIWGREVIHLDLNTRGAATAVKPLPIGLDTLFALTGSAAGPVLWMLTARAAALFAIAMAFRLGLRLHGVAAGLIAAAVVAVSDEYLGYLFMRGMSEPAATAAVLAAVDAHLSGRRRATLCWLAVAGLLRPEAWPFLFVYCLWLARSGSALRRVATLAVGVAVPASWFVIDWFGSGKLSNSAEAAQHSSQGGPLLHHHPGIATLRETWTLMSGPVVVLFLLAAAWSIVLSARSRRVTPLLGLSVLAVGWTVIDAVLAEGRFATGAPRYLLPAAALAAVVLGVVVVQTIEGVARRLSWRRAQAMCMTAAVVALVLVLIPRLDETGHQVRTGARIAHTAARLQTSVQQAVTIAGGRAAVLRCGVVATEPFSVPLVAWTLDVPVGHVVIVVGRSGTVLRRIGAPTVPAGVASSYRTVGAVGPPDARWTVLSTCA